MVDTAEGWKTLVTSANPHDGSSQHSNVALLVTGNTAIDVLKTEQTVAHMSQGDVPMVILGEIAGIPSQPAGTGADGKSNPRCNPPLC